MCLYKAWNFQFWWFHNFQRHLYVRWRTFQTAYVREGELLKINKVIKLKLNRLLNGKLNWLKFADYTIFRRIPFFGRPDTRNKLYEHWRIRCYRDFCDNLIYSICVTTTRLYCSLTRDVLLKTAVACNGGIHTTKTFPSKKVSRANLLRFLKLLFL